MWSQALALTTLLALLVGWLSVQRAWRRAFPDTHGDPDALAGRIGCRQTPCDRSCEGLGSRDCARREEETT